MRTGAALLSSIVLVGLVGATSPARTSADTVDKLTFLTFSGTVQIPGAQLNAGTYRFRLADPTDARNVLQVLSYDGMKVYSTFHTIPDNRNNVTSEATVTFRETPAGVPPAVKSLFYGGERRGYEFVYPKGEPKDIVEQFPQPEVLYTPSNVAAVTETPSVAPDSDFVEAVPETVESTIAPESTTAAVYEQQPVVLPQTASSVPLVALGGLSSIVVGLGFGLIRRFIG